MSQLSPPVVPVERPRRDGGGSAAAPDEIYRARCERFARERDRLSGRWNRVANVRLAAFVAAAPCLVWGVAGWAVVVWARLLLLLGLLLAAGFVALVVYHRRLGQRRGRAAGLWQINDEARRRLARAWDELPLRETAPADPGHPYADDLDILGRASLFHLLGWAYTPFGEATLRRWLLEPAPAGRIRARQGAVAELAPLLDLRDELALRVRQMDEAAPDPEPFLAWAEDAPRLRRRPRLLWGARANVALVWLLGIAQIGGLTPYPLWLPFALANLVLLQVLVPGARGTIRWVYIQDRAYGHYAELFRLLSSAPLRAPALTALQSELAAEGVAAHRQMRRLHRLATFAIPWSAPFYWPLQTLTLWDVHVLAALEGWQAAAGGRVRAWLAALGEVEALSALAGLAHAQPGWAFPDSDGTARVLEAERLGHPLLPNGVRVDNDVMVGPPGTFLLVTGSNMSGKSTLLRAIGVNLVLAGAGGPVCAAALRAPPVALWTSMRVQDSLERGVSYFMAELQRLKQVVDGVRQAAGAGECLPCYLLDEILQGTNTAERQVAARRIIGYLVGRGAIGAVSTHDLSLAETPVLAAAARPIHFSETIASGTAGPSMSFDYTVRPGIATSTNALKLMEIVGLDLEDGAP